MSQRAFSGGVVKVRVFVSVCDGVEEYTETYSTEEAANRRYEAYARESGVPYDEERQDFDWGTSEDYSAWTSECEVQ